MSSKYSRWPPGAMVTRLALQEKQSGRGTEREVGSGKRLIINQSCESKWRLDTTAQMVTRWTNQLIVGAQMEQMGLLPRTTGIHARLN